MACHIQNSGRSGNVILLILAVILFLASISSVLILTSLPETDPAKTNDPAMLLDLAIVIQNTIKPKEIPDSYPVLVSGKPEIGKMAHDEVGLTQGYWYAIKRYVQTYAFSEEKIPENELKPGPKTIEDRYRYKAEWLDDPKPWKKLKVWKGHKYYSSRFKNTEYYASSISIGRLLLSLEEGELFGWQKFKIAKNDSLFEQVTHDDTYLYQTEKALNEPEPGNFRMHYEVIKAGKDHPVLTVFGQLKYNRLGTFTTSNKHDLMYVLPGTIEELKDIIGRPPISAKQVKTLQSVLPILAGLLLLCSIVLFAFGIKKKR